MAKYVIDIPDDGRVHLGWGIKAFRSGDNVCFVGDMSQLTPYTEPDKQEIRKAVEDEVWNFFCEVEGTGISADDYKEIYGIGGVLICESYQEAKAKYDAWKKEKEEIRAGDEVRHNPSEEIAIVIRATSASVYCIVTSGEELELAQWNIYNLAKTGRRFPEVVKLLEEMKEEP